MNIRIHKIDDLDETIPNFESIDELNKRICSDMIDFMLEKISPILFKNRVLLTTRTANDDEDAKNSYNLIKNLTFLFAHVMNNVAAHGINSILLNSHESINFINENDPKKLIANSLAVINEKFNEKITDNIHPDIFEDIDKINTHQLADVMILIITNIVAKAVESAYADLDISVNKDELH